jgi:hypothetical protein
MADTTHTIGSTGIVKKLVDLGDGTYADAVVDYGGGGVQDAAVVLAAPTGSAGGLGKLAATLANTQAIYVRFDASTRPYQYVDWLTAHAQQADLVFYKAQSIVDSVSLTLASFTDTNTIIINGITYTGEATANTANWAGWKFSTAGAADTDDALALANLINTDYVIATDGTIELADTIVVTTNEAAYTFVAAAAPDYPNRIFDQSGNAAAQIASIVLAINHKGTVTCSATVSVGDTVTVGGVTYTAKAGAEDTATHYFSKDTGANETGISLAACINADTTAQHAHGISASNNAGVVTLTRTTPTALGLASSNNTRLAVEQPAGVPGVLATAGPLTAGEVGIAPVWVSTLTVTETGSDLTVTDIDCPGILATPAAAIVTLTPGMPGAPTGQELATVISATSAANCTVSQAGTLAGLMVDLTPTAALNEALTTGTAGSLHTQAVGGYPYCYLGLTADNATPQAVSISAIGRV